MKVNVNSDREKFRKALRKDNICEENDEPLAMLIVGSLFTGPNFMKACRWAGIEKDNPEAKGWWSNLHKNGFMTTKSVHFDPKSENAGIELGLAMNVAMDRIKMVSVSGFKTKEGKT